METRRPAHFLPLRPAALVLFALAAALPRFASAGIVTFYGKVLMEDGSPPGRLVGIQRVCDGAPGPVREGTASAKTGEYFLRLYVDPFGSGFAGLWGGLALNACYLEAVAAGFTSTRLSLADVRITGNPRLPDLVLSRQVPGALADINQSPALPRSAQKPWALALKRLTVQDWVGAEAALRSVVAAAPNLEPAWAALGAVCQNQHKPAEARPALERAVQLAPKRLPLYMALATVLMELKDWAAAARTSEALIQADTGHVYLEAYLDNAVARFQQQDRAGALARMNELVLLDKRRLLPRAEFILGTMLEAGGDLDAAARHLRRYLELSPRAKDAAAVADRLANLGRQPSPDLAAEVSAANLDLGAGGEAPVPGGIKAFAAISEMRETPTYQDFFLQYCRAIVAGGPDHSNPTREVSQAIGMFVRTVGQLELLGERAGDRTVIRLDLDSEPRRRKTATALTLLGWRLRPAGEGFDVELGDQPIDGLRQRIPAAFGIDVFQLREALAARRPFQFEIPVESARLVGGAAWTTVLKGTAEASLAPVDVFLRDRRFARLYSALAAMDSQTAAAVVSAVGFTPLIATYSDLLAEYGEALTVAGDRVAVPGGPQAEPVWARLAGTNPRNPPAFLRALIEKDRGLLLAFWFDLARADARHQQFFTATPGRAEAFYRWYRDSAAQGPPPPTPSRWQAAILQKLSLDANGSVQWPGGRAAWTDDTGRADDEVLLHLSSLEPLAAIAQLELKRARPLDQPSAKLLAQRFLQWRHLFPYFEKLPDLAEPEFHALSLFTDALAGAPPRQQALLAGDWHSLVELIVLASEAGSLKGPRAAHAFSRVCQALPSGNPSAKAIATLREIMGGPADVDEALASGLLRLSGAGRQNFERVKELQGVPRIASLGDPPDPAGTLAALSGAVYAALLDPGYLLVAEDPALLAKHDFLPRTDGPLELFADSGLAISNQPPGSKLTGGFGGFRQLTLALAARTTAAGPAEPARDGPPALPPTVGSGSPPNAPLAPIPAGPVFQAKGRIVEVYATVTDGRGRYIDDLGRGQFSLRVEGEAIRVLEFENQTSHVSVALLFDTTGSMTPTLPSLKRAALQLIDELRPGDYAAAYGFADKVTEFEGFTTDKTALKRAVLRAHPAGTTALYDALVRVSRDLAPRHGKKVIVVFTDGDDNASMLTADAAILRAKARGIPIFTIAAGDTTRLPRLVRRLADLSQATGGAPFLIQKPDDIAAAFQRISDDLAHGYLLVFQPPPAAAKQWHPIAVAVSDRKGVLIRARQGYYSE